MSFANVAGALIAVLVLLPGRARAAYQSSGSTGDPAASYSVDYAHSAYARDGMRHAAARGSLSLPAPSWAVDDPADSIYRAARTALADGDYRQAAKLFHEIGAAYPQSAYAGTAYYYEAFALYRSGEMPDLRSALGALQHLSALDPAQARRADATALHTRICTALARQGDESCATQIVRAGTAAAADSSCPSESDDNDVRIAALNGLMQMDGSRALPILQKVLARRDDCSVGLRRKALFLISQREAPESTTLLLRTARDDPDETVREQAVFWLSQVDDPHTVGMLDSILTHADNDALREKALFALSQQSGDRGLPALRAFAERDDVPVDLRAKAIFWIGQVSGRESAGYLEGLFTKIKDQDLKEKILFSLSQHHDESDWILGVAADKSQSEELRKKALFWAAQSGIPVSRLTALYAQLTDSELREQVIFALGQRHEPAALDALIAIAKNDKDPEARKKAVFWLGQSSDPRAAQFLQELINQ